MPNFRICSIPGCGKPVRTSGWCSAHYQRWRNHGDPLAGGPPKPGKGSKMRYVREVAMPYEGNACLIWPFPFGKRAGMFVNGHNIQASRVVCELAYGPPPSPIHEAAHSCGKGHMGCVNKRHLRWATPKENNDDTILHGTKTQGEKVHTARLTTQDVLEIRSIGRTVIARKLAARFGVDRTTIGDILNRRSWNHLPPTP